MRENPRSNITLSALVLALLALPACDGGGIDGVELVDLIAWPAGASLSGVGSTTQFTASALGSDGESLSPSVVWTSLNPNVATIDPVTGVATAVASGQTVISVEVADGPAAYSLLTVAVPDVDPVTSWTETHVGPCIRDVWGTSTNDVFAVGNSERKEVLHWDGSDWLKMDTGGEVYAFFSVWGTASDDVFAVGSFGAIWHYDGTAWTRMDNGDVGHLWHVWGAAPDDVYAGPLHYDGLSWGPAVGGAGIWGTSADNRYSGGGAWGFSENDVWRVGPGVSRFDGTEWSDMGNPCQDADGQGGCLDVWGTSGSDMYAVGAGGLVHWDGTSWSKVIEGTGNPEFPFRAVWGISSGDVFVAGGCGKIYRGTR